MDPSIWGPHAWHFLHVITLNYPNNPTIQQKKNYKMFFYNLINILPCSYCSHNYISHLNQLPIDPFLKNKKSLVSWLIQIHNLTNKHLNKNTHFTFNEFITTYKSIYSSPKFNYPLIIFIIVFIILIIISYIYYPYIITYLQSFKSTYLQHLTNIIPLSFT